MTEKHVKLAQDIYDDRETLVSVVRVKDEFRMVLGIHQRSSSEPLLICSGNGQVDS